MGEMLNESSISVFKVIELLLLCTKKFLTSLCHLAWASIRQLDEIILNASAGTLIVALGAYIRY